jgi:hypothetical protein
MLHPRLHDAAVASGDMSFFEPPPPPEPGRRPVSLRPPPWAGHGDNVLAAPVSLSLLLARNDRAAVRLDWFAASPNGISLQLSARLREAWSPLRSGPRLFRFHRPFDRDGELSPEFLRFGVQLGDGTTATNLDRRHPRRGEQPEGALLTPHGGGGGGGLRFDQGWFLWPLPPPGLITYVCEWPLFEIPETRVEATSDALIEAASSAVELWPDDRPAWDTGDDDQ